MCGRSKIKTIIIIIIVINVRYNNAVGMLSSPSSFSCEYNGKTRGNPKAPSRTFAISERRFDCLGAFLESDRVALHTRIVRIIIYF